MTSSEPLAAALRPQTLDAFVGQEHILGIGQPLRHAIEHRQLHSMLLWGPPGVGKTTLAHLIARHSEAALAAVSAVLAGVKDIRAAVERARQRRELNGQATILFADEVHRFNKSQQDAFLPFVEDGTVVFIGATTENPSFALNNALLSRTRLYVLKPLTPQHLVIILRNALTEPGPAVQVEEDVLSGLAAAADGDARRALNLLELILQLAEEDGDGVRKIKVAHLHIVLQESWRRFDKGGDQFYEQISALHKAVRGSSPDAALYWLGRMLDGGCDPLYIARRMLRMASEDIGNADPRALRIALDAWQVYERLGSPEGELALAQAVTFLACAAKSNAVYTAYNAVMADIKQSPAHPVPLHLRNAPTQLHKTLGYGAEYRYAHDESEGFAAGENYLPEALQGKSWYQPVDRGMESKIKQKLDHLRALNQQSDKQRYGG